MSCLPWQETAWQRMLTVASQNQLTHAWLIHGAKGTGRQQFVHNLSQYLLCEQPGADAACGHCQSCHWFAAETHPDSIVISPEDEGKAIKVDQIRDLIEVLSLSAHGKQGRRVVIISPAEAMNRQAANSLLKSLEEPPANTYFFLIATEISALPATIRSRCQLLNLPSPDLSQATAWLEQAFGASPENALALDVTNNAPIAALELLDSGAIPIYQQLFQGFIEAGMQQQSPFTLAEQWLKQEQYMPIKWLLRWMSVLIKLKQAGACVSAPLYSAQGVESLLQSLSLQQFYRFYDDVLEANRLWAAPLNRRLQLESLFTKWLALFR